MKTNNQKINSSYLISFACFTCRKTFKRPFVEMEETRICSLCNGTEYFMGRKFRSPSKENKTEWKIIENITRQGYWGNFSTAEGKKIPFPKSIKGVSAFVEEIENQKNERVKQEEAMELKQKRERLNRRKKTAAKVRANRSR